MRYIWRHFPSANRRVLRDFVDCLHRVNTEKFEIVAGWSWRSTVAVRTIVRGVRTANVEELALRHEGLHRR
jgi:hypothetical protein